MKWFKHSTLASKEVPVRDIRNKYGFYGLGIFWCIMEDVCLNEGRLTVGDLKRMYCSSRFSSTKVEDIILGFGCFKLDAHACVSVDDNLIANMRSNEHAANTQQAHSSNTAVLSNARTYNREDKEKKRKDNITTKPPTVGPVVIDGGDDDIEFKYNLSSYRLNVDIENALKSLYNAPLADRQKLDIDYHYDGMLVRNWIAVVDEFIKYWRAFHSNTKLQNISTLHTYFSGYIHKERKTGERLYAFLQAEEAMRRNAERERQMEESKCDFMSTYFGPPLPDNAPPRPSHTAYFNFGSDRWEEPRVIKGKPNPNFHFNQ